MMRPFITFLIFLNTFFGNTQTIIWSEDFEAYPNGTQNTTKWTTTANNCDGDVNPPEAVPDNWWGVRTTFGDKEFCCEDIEGLTCCSSGSSGEGNSDNLWISEVIDISGYTNISISIFMRAEGNMECGSCGSGQDLFKSEYQIDGGSWINFLSICGINDGQSILDCIDVGTGTSLRIRVILGNQANTEEYYFDDIFVYESNCSVVLPIELTSFIGNYNELTGYDELKWSTASEINNDRFDLYSSIDGIDWELIGSMNGAGNSTTQQHYTYNYRSNSQITYYKLKQVDYDGEYKYSDIISVYKENKMISVRYFDILGKELPSEPENGLFIKMVQYEYQVEYKKIFKQ